jgi:selenide,water dikinase
LAQVLQPLKSIFPIEDYPDLLVGLSAPDDAAVYRLNGEQAVVSTTDFFPPVVDDYYDFGAIAAANALSDIYAVGAEPLLAINLVAYPDGYDLRILSDILRGGAEKVREAGAVIAGGHTVTDKEPKYGLAVTGLVHPDQVMTKGGARPGDMLILTKALGTGVITTALKRDLAAPEPITAAVASMSRLNRDASRAAREVGAHAMTDITGYSLVGHAHEMAHLSNVDFEIELAALHWLPGALDYAEQHIFPGGMSRNQDYFRQWIGLKGKVDNRQLGLLFDPQTSGGLLIAVDAKQANMLYHKLINAGDTASIIGQVQPGSGKIFIRA